MRSPAQQPSVTLNLRFKKGSDELLPESVAVLQNLGRALQEDRLRHFLFRIEGHTCDLGGEALNLRLSRNRAEAVSAYLVRTFDLPAAQFRVAGYGEQRPMVPNADEAARRQNRRVVIVNTLDSYAAGAEAMPRVDVKVKYTREARNQEYELMESGVLTQSDNYAIEFTPTADAHVYVYQMDASGALIPLFPGAAHSTEENPVQAGRLYRIPDHGNWFYLDNNTGRERFIVLAHKTGLQEPARICRKVVSPTPASPDQGVMIASGSGWRNEGAAQRGLMGVRPDSETAGAAPAAPPSSPVDPGEVFVWQLAFNHK